MRTLLWTRSEVETLLDPLALVPALRSAFVAYTVLFPGAAPGVPAYTVKVHAKFPQQEPAIRGVLCLHEA